MKKVFLLIFLCLVLSHGKASDFDLTQGYRDAYMEILRLRFDNAIRIINREKHSNPANVSHAFLQNYIDFLKVLISEEEQNFDNFFRNKPSRVKLILTVNHSSPWYLYAQAQMNLQSGIILVKSGDYLKAAVDIRKAYHLFVRNDILFPDFKPNKAGLGLLHVLIGSIPDSFKWVPGIFNMEGNINLGLKELHNILSDSRSDEIYPYLFNECLFITSFVTYNLAGNESNTLMFLNIIKDEFVEREVKKNPLLIYAISSFYAHQGLNDKALSFLINRPQDKSYYSFHYLDYLAGVSKLNRLDKDARTYFLRYIANFKGRNFIKASYQRIAWSYLLENNYSDYQKNISRIELFGSEDMESDKEAMSIVRKNKTPHVELLKARLLFDGGYYVRAAQVLKTTQTDAFSLQELVEYSYRQARVQHKSGNLSKAKELYHNTYRIGRNLPEYYAANSLLNLGNIYEHEGNLIQAMVCYRECLKLDFTEYRNSILLKAKAGINRLS